MIDIDEWSITKAVEAANAGGQNSRIVHLVNALVRHLHDFAREVQLTEEEWFEGIRFLTQVGHITDERRQEFILLSDTLGLSTLVTAQNHSKPAGCTEATVFGPFYVEGSPQYLNGEDIANGAQGEPCFVSGTVRGEDGRVIAGAEISVWQSDSEGYYDVQRPEIDRHQARGVVHSLPDGRYHFKSLLAAPYRIPHDGPVGRMLEALGRHPWRPAHLHFMIKAEGYETLITHIFQEGGQYLESDAVFGVRSSLVTHWDRHEPGQTPDGKTADEAFYTLHYDFVLSRSKGE
jgi:hydroxyquinol 1,2-dioxygenase